jgi:hypothetical protein
MTLYLISITPGFDPNVDELKSLGFIDASSKAKAIAQAAKSQPYPYSRLQARTQSEVGNEAWEIELEMFPKLPIVCQFADCPNRLRADNRSGFCWEHQEQKPERKKRKRSKS